MVSPIMGTTRLTKVLMDGGSGLKLYASTLNKIGSPRSNLRTNKALFYGIMLGKQVIRLRAIWHNVTFGQLDNSRKEPLTFEVVDFPGVYHTLLG